MKKRTVPRFILFILFCLGLNVGGRQLAITLNLPLWLDSIGTALCAYATGPVCGIIVGATGNLLSGMINRFPPYYALVSVSLAFFLGHAGRKKALDTFPGAMICVGLSTVVSVAIAFVLNEIFFGGQTGNSWGNDVITFMTLHFGWSKIPADFTGQFYLDFPDKFITVLLIYAGVKLRHEIRRRKKKSAASPGELAGIETDRSLEVRATALIGAVLIGAACVPGYSVRAEEETENSPADYHNYVQTVFNSQNGLPCGEANDIVQTNDGILWIGTYAGLYRYNGREFRWMSEYNSVRNVNCLYVDEEGRLWIGTNDNGLSICINEEISNVVDSSSGLSSNSVRAIIQSSDGYYYIGTTGSLQILTLQSGLSLVNTLREANYVDSIAADQSGHIAAVSSDGRLFLMQQGQILSSRQIPGGSEAFRCCAFDAQGRLLAGTTESSIRVYDISDGTFQELETILCPGLINLKDLHQLEDGRLLVSSDHGIGYVDASKRFHPINTNSFNTSIDNILLDYQGNLWFTSSRLGLLRMAPSSFLDVYSTAGMNSTVVNTIVRWQDIYWFGTDTGLDAVDLDFRKPIVNDLTKALAGSRIRCMMADTNNHLWICTYNRGLIEVEPDGTQYLYNRDNGSFGNQARLVYQLKDGTVIAGGDTGISWIRDHQVIRTIGTADGLVNPMILTVTELDSGVILAGTDGDGLAVLENGRISHILKRGDGLSSEVILRTVKDPKSDGVFIVTSNGLCYMAEDGTISTLDHFPYFNNYNIFFSDEDTMFVMSSAGIFIVDRDDLLSGTENLSYDLLDGRRGLNSALTANSWNWYEENGDLFLPCDSGVFVLNTRSYSAGALSYRMMISELRLDNQMVKPERSEKIVIARDIDKLEIMPEIINYTIQDPYVGYWLEGFDKQETILPLSSISSIAYTNLYPGEYTFHLAVYDSTEQKVLAQRVYPVIKESASYDSPAFLVYLLTIPMLLGAAITISIYQVHVQRVSREQQRQIAETNQRLKMADETILAIANTVDKKDVRTGQHSYRVSLYSRMMAEELGWSPKECEDVRQAARLHDIGKIGIDDSILRKDRGLTDQEYRIMKSHTTLGFDILKNFSFSSHAAEVALSHHERYDGRGYPEGKKGDEIPLYSRLVGVADAFDAMTAARSYKSQMSMDYVLNELRKGRGTQFDPQMVDALLHLLDSGKIDVEKMYATNRKEEAELKAAQEAKEQLASEMPDSIKTGTAIVRETPESASGSGKAAEAGSAEKEAKNT